MRADMGKVLVERPRPGSRQGSRPHKGYGKGVRRALESDDGGPVREGIRAPYSSRRFFNEHLAPLRRYLDSNVGRPWNLIYSEICAHVDRGNVVQKHILTHLFDYVIRETILVDGVPCLGRRIWYGEYGQPLRGIRTPYDRWYVCPRSGLLCRFDRRKREPNSHCNKPKPTVAVRRLGDTMGYRIVGAGVELIRLAPLPENWSEKVGFDVLLARPWRSLSESEIRKAYGRLLYCVERWIASKRELKQYPVPFELIR